MYKEPGALMPAAGPGSTATAWNGSGRLVDRITRPLEHGAHRSGAAALAGTQDHGIQHTTPAARGNGFVMGMLDNIGPTSLLMPSGTRCWLTVCYWSPKTLNRKMKQRVFIG